MDEKQLSEIISEVLREYENKAQEAGKNFKAPSNSGDGDIPVGVSARHIHLTQEDCDTLFGPSYQLTKLKDLSQPGQFACKEQLTLIGPSLRAIEGVRVLGPLRKNHKSRFLKQIPSY